MFNIFRSRQKPKVFEFKCAECGEIHRGSPSFSYAKPDYYFDVPEDEITDRVELSDDLCRIIPPANEPDEQTIYSIRTILEIPIVGADEPFTFGVWVSQSEESFERYVETFDQDQTDDFSFGWLLVSMPYYNQADSDENLESLACDVEWSTIGQRPKCFLQECDHPMFIDQNKGITWEKAIEITRLFMHG